MKEDFFNDLKKEILEIKDRHPQLLIRSFVKPHYTLAEPSITWLHQEAMWLYL